MAAAVWYYVKPTPQPPAPTVAPAPKPAVVVEQKPIPIVEEAVAELKLTTGRVLYDVMARNFSETAVSVTHRDGKQIIPYEQFPAEYRDALLDRMPRPKALDPKEEARKMAAIREKAQKKAEQAQAANEAAWAQQREQENAAVRNEVNLEIHESLARSHAYRFFDAKYDPTGSGTGYITDLSVTIGAAEQVAGWEGRYRVTGSAAYRMWESAGRSMNQGSRSFEVITEQKGREVKVIDFTLK